MVKKSVPFAGSTRKGADRNALKARVPTPRRTKKTTTVVGHSQGGGKWASGQETVCSRKAVVDTDCALVPHLTAPKSGKESCELSLACARATRNPIAPWRSIVEVACRWRPWHPTRRPRHGSRRGEWRSGRHSGWRRPPATRPRSVPGKWVHRHPSLGSLSFAGIGCSMHRGWWRIVLAQRKGCHQ